MHCYGTWIRHCALKHSVKALPLHIILKNFGHSQIQISKTVAWESTMLSREICLIKYIDIAVQISCHQPLKLCIHSSSYGFDVAFIVDSFPSLVLGHAH